MNWKEAEDLLYLGGGDFLEWSEFGELDPDEPKTAVLPVLQWQDELKTRFPRGDLSSIRQYLRLANAVQEYYELTGRHLNVYGAMAELYGAMVWGIQLHKLPNAQGSDGKRGNAFVEIKAIGPRSKSNRVAVKLSGHFSELLVVKFSLEGEGNCDYLGGATSRLVRRKDLGAAKTGMARLAWSRACEIGLPPSEV
jgi:hypothetical protein